jgi:hypothetical protein
VVQGVGPKFKPQYHKKKKKKKNLDLLLWAMKSHKICKQESDMVDGEGAHMNIVCKKYFTLQDAFNIGSLLLFSRNCGTTFPSHLLPPRVIYQKPQCLV